MTLTIGRASFTNGPTSVAQEGDQVNINFNILPTTLVEAKVRRAQVLGLANNQDEPVVPVTSTDDPDLDGFYAVQSAVVEPTDAWLHNKLMRASVSLRRVANGYQNPILETYVVSRLVTNSHGVASTTDFGIAAVHRNNEENDLMDYTGLTGLTTSAEPIEMSDTTDMIVTPFANVNVAAYWGRYGTPSLYYSPPSCKIEYQVSGTWYEAVGRQIPMSVPWRISNGVVRIGADVFPSVDDCRIEVWDDSSAAWTGRYINGATAEIGGNAGPFIVRNSPETCTVRVQSTAAGFTTWTLHRGGVIAHCHQSINVADNLGIRLVSTVAGTNVTGGIRMTSNDASGNRLVLLTRSAVTTDTAVTAITTTASATSAVFSVGYNRSASGTGFFSEAGQLGALCTPPQWSQRVAAR